MRTSSIFSFPLQYFFHLQVTQVGDDAEWRAQPLSNDELLQRILENGQRISPIFTIPWVTSRIFRKDWLHCADQGIAVEFLGNLFHYLRGKFAGSVKVRTARLWERVQNFYEAKNVQDRLQTLTPSMIKMDKKGPALRSSAAQCRALVPFALEIAQELLSPAEPKEQAMIAAARHFRNCYDALSSTSIFFADILREESKKFALQYIALRAVETNDQLWKCKPKLHLFVELCSEGSRPATFWTYRDEDFGGSVAKMSKRRGGQKRHPSLLFQYLDAILDQEPCY